MVRTIPRNPLLLQVLSLYLLLLAFFVLLNSLSATREDRLRAVKGSLSETFATTGTPATETRQLSSSAGNILSHAGFLDRIGSLVRTELAFASVRHITPGRLMEVSMPTERLFSGRRVAVDPLYRPTIVAMADALRHPRRGVRYEVEILVGAGGDRVLPGARSAYLATVFTGAGAPRRCVAAGVEYGAPGLLTLRFRVRSGGNDGTAGREGGR